MASFARSRVVRRLVVIAAIAATAAVSAVAPATGTIHRRTPPVRTARLELRLTTTSDWTKVLFESGRVLVQRVVSRPGDVTVWDGPDGWVVSSSLESATIVIRAVFEGAPDAESVGIRIEKGSIGKTTLQLTNDGNVPFRIGEFVNDRTDGGTNEKSWSRSRSEFFREEAPTFRRADGRRLVIAAYYPWFSSDSYDNPQLADRPIGRPDTARRADVYAMTKQAADHGIDGFLFSWQGAQQSWFSFGLALEAAATVGNVVTPYLETFGANPARDASQPTDRQTIKQWISEALDRAGSPAFLRAEGIPVMFVYGMANLPAAEWTAILDELAEDGRKVRLVGDAPARLYGGPSWGFHSYVNLGTFGEVKERNRVAAADARLLGDRDRSAPHLYVATVSPGYDDHRAYGDGNPIYPRGPNGEFYEDMWRAALAADPDWVLVTSWNEWYEGTSVQPGEINGDLALRQTAEFAARFGSTVVTAIGSPWRASRRR